VLASLNKINLENKMFKKEVIINNIAQIYSLAIKDLKLKFRFKSEFFIENIFPFLSLFIPFIIFNALFSLNSQFFEGYYSKDNYILFLLLGYCIECNIFLLWYYQELFYQEKIWKTLNGLMIAPTRKFNVLLGFLISGLITRSFSIILTVIICYILYPIPIYTLIIVIVILMSISLTFASMGFIIGLFEIVNENISASLSVGLSIISIVSCVFYPIEIFPESIRIYIKLNPLYYYFDLLRLTWWTGIDFKQGISYITIFHVLVVIIFTIALPIISSYLFLKIYKKYGVSGY
jgi:ABC-2 type transport system permease protein